MGDYRGHTLDLLQGARGEVLSAKASPLEINPGASLQPRESAGEGEREGESEIVAYYHTFPYIGESMVVCT